MITFVQDTKQTLTHCAGVHFKSDHFIQVFFPFLQTMCLRLSVEKKKKKKTARLFLESGKIISTLYIKGFRFFFVVFLFCFYYSVPNFLSAFYSNFNLKFLYSLKVCIYIQIHGFRDLNLMHCNFHNWYFSAFPFWI